MSFVSPKNKYGSDREFEVITDKVLKLIFSSVRSMPAYFCGGTDGREKSFCVDFPALTEDIEYELSSLAWKCLSDFLAAQNEDVDRQSYAALVKIGEDIMLGSFIFSKLGHKSLIPIINIAIKAENKKRIDGLGINFDSSAANKYFLFCSDQGLKAAHDSIPQTIKMHFAQSA